MQRCRYGEGGLGWTGTDGDVEKGKNYSVGIEAVVCTLAVAIGNGAALPCGIVWHCLKRDRFRAEIVIEKF